MTLQNGVAGDAVPGVVFWFSLFANVSTTPSGAPVVDTPAVIVSLKVVREILTMPPLVACTPNTLFDDKLPLTFILDAVPLA